MVGQSQLLYTMANEDPLLSLTSEKGSKGLSSEETF